MNAQTSEALWKSIEHWLWNYDNPEGALINPKYCALCHAFIEKTNSCNGCPIFEKTGQGYCRGTPYHEVYLSLISYRNKSSTLKQLREAIEKEYAFLVDLIPYRTRKILR
jgi:hypothetical protein